MNYIELLQNSEPHKYSMTDKLRETLSKCEETDELLFKRGVDIGKSLTSASNVMNSGSVAAGICYGLISDHRTLQQSVFQMFIDIISTYKDAPYDLRNMAAVKACERLNEVIKEESIHLPTI